MTGSGSSGSQDDEKEGYPANINNSGSSPAGTGSRGSFGTNAYDMPFTGVPEPEDFRSFLFAMMLLAGLILIAASCAPEELFEVYD